MTTRSVSLLAVLTAGAIAGCGGSSGPSLSDFKSGFTTDKKSLKALGTDLGNAITTAGHKTNAQLATEFQTLSTRATQEASQLRKLSAPAGYKSYLDKLTTSLGSVATDLHSISTAATAGNATNARAATTRLLADAAKVKTNDNALSKKLGVK